VKFVVGLLLTATIISIVAMTAMYLLVGRRPSVAASSTLILRPGGEIPELIPDVVLPIRGSPGSW
jgi:hypothetical protein